MPPDMEKRLQRILKDAYTLQAEYEETVFSLPVSGLSSSDLNEVSSELSLYKERLSDSDNDSTTDSFVSATEVRTQYFEPHFCSLQYDKLFNCSGSQRKL